MVFVFNEITYKSKKAFFYAMNPDRQNEKVTQNEVDMFMYHNNIAYHEHKRHTTEINTERPRVVTQENTQNLMTKYL